MPVIETSAVTEAKPQDAPTRRRRWAPPRVIESAIAGGTEGGVVAGNETVNPGSFSIS